MKYMIRWAQIQPREGPEAYDWAFILGESLKLAIIWGSFWWLIQALFPAA